MRLPLRMYPSWFERHCVRPDLELPALVHGVQIEPSVEFVAAGMTAMWL